MLKIIGGELRGRLLKSPKNAPVRPTTGILRKSVFDICQDRISDARFLDLFAGSGAIGIEALSRGAAHATFVDQNPRCILCIQENLRALKLEERATLLKGDVLTMLQRLEQQQKEFDLIYIDPPYSETHHCAELLTFLDDSNLARLATIFLEQASFTAPNFVLSHFRLKDTRRFGRSALHQYLRNVY